MGAIGVLLAAAATPDVASGSCASAVVVDGRLLYGRGGFDDRYGRSTLADDPLLPPRTGTADAIYPACNDTNGSSESDKKGTVLRLRGLPPTVAVVDQAVQTLYLAPGQVTESAAHPLHRLLLHGGRPTRFHGCGHRVHVRNAVGAEVAFAYPAIVASGEPVRLDVGTRITNRPPYEPIVEGQRFRVVTARCWGRLVARRITFTGPRPPLRPYVVTSGRSTVELVLAVGLPLLLITSAIIGWTRRERSRT